MNTVDDAVFGPKPEPGTVPTRPASRWARDFGLIQRCILGESEAWRDLVVRYEQTVFYAARNTFRLHGVDASEDLLVELQAEIFFRLVRNDFYRLRRYRGRCGLKHWLKVVSGNFVVDYLRKKRPEFSLDDPGVAELTSTLTANVPAPDARLLADENRQLLTELCVTLRGDDRRFVQLFYAEELPFEVVAETMNTTVGALYSRKNRVRKKLRAELERRRTRHALDGR